MSRSLNLSLIRLTKKPYVSLILLLRLVILDFLIHLILHSFQLVLLPPNLHQVLLNAQGFQFRQKVQKFDTKCDEFIYFISQVDRYNAILFEG